MPKWMALFAGAALGTALATTARGADLFECLGPDLVRSIVAPTTTNNDIAISDDVPPELADYDVPAGFVWIGAVHGEVRKIAAFGTDLTAEAALATAAESLESAGWTTVAMPARLQAFLFEGQPSGTMQLCRDGHNGSLVVRDVDGRRYVNLAYSAQAGQSSCRSAPRMPPSFGNAEEMPTLRFPAGTSQPGGISGGSSGRGVTMSTRIRADATPDALVALLGDQLLAQGWSIDSRWNGRHAAGGNWVRRSDAGSQLLSTLAIVRQADGTMAVQLKTGPL